jgi:hypothetical protein
MAKKYLALGPVGCLVHSERPHLGAKNPCIFFFLAMVRLPCPSRHCAAFGHSELARVAGEESTKDINWDYVGSVGHGLCIHVR